MKNKYLTAKELDDFSFQPDEFSKFYTDKFGRKIKAESRANSAFMNSEDYPGRLNVADPDNCRSYVLHSVPSFCGEVILSNNSDFFASDFSEMIAIIEGCFAHHGAFTVYDTMNCYKYVEDLSKIAKKMDVNLAVQQFENPKSGNEVFRASLIDGELEQSVIF